MRNDHSVSSRRLTRIVVQRGCARGLANRKMPKASSTAAAPIRSVDGSTTAAAPSASATTSAIDSSWPSAIGRSARSTALRLRCCMPWETANSQPIAGLRPW